MKSILWLLSLFAAAVAVAVVAANNAGYVVIVYPPYRVEFSLALLSIFLLLGFVVGYLSVRLVFNIFVLPSRVRRFRLGRLQKKLQDLKESMLIAFFEGHYKEAEKFAGKARKFGESSGLYSIVGARSVHELGDFKKRDEYLSASKDSDATMRLMATSKFMLDQHDPLGALNALNELRGQGVKNNIEAMRMELNAYQSMENWDEVLSTLEELEKREAIDAMDAKKMRHSAWLNKINVSENLQGVKDCLKKMPKNIKHDSQVIKAAVRSLMRFDGGLLAQQLLVDHLSQEWDRDLVVLYADCQIGDAVSQIQQAEKWLSQHRQDEALLLTLGRLCTHQKLWGKAQSYLDASVSIAPTSAAYTAMGQLAEQLGNADDAHRYYESAKKLDLGLGRKSKSV